VRATTDAVATEPLSEPRPDRRLRSRRRSYLVDRRMQLRAAGLAVVIVLALLVFLNLTVYSASAERSRALVRTDPQLVELVQAQDRAVQAVVLLGSAVFLVGVFLVSIIETHRTAGACVAVVRQLRELETGRLGVELRLRNDDTLRELEPAFNAMSGSLARRAWEDVEELEDLASRISGGAVPSDPETVARLLWNAAARRRTQIEPLDGSAGSGIPASRNPFARSTQASQRPHGWPAVDGS